ncbi:MULTISPECIES: flagellar protein FlaG [unclassified Psychromonas]|uniref:flagellar protein FlaG n=1 Tax=unclassified Psychromonas TaxID=2614957 RepID=UPI000419B3D6|nr:MULTISPECIES: flagellar protein FlaG [unclassified Psychromonas]
MSELNITNPVMGNQTVNTEKPIDATIQSTASSTKESAASSVLTIGNDVDKIEKATAASDQRENNEETKVLTADEISETVEEMNSFLQEMKRNLSFSVDEDLGKNVITVKDTENDEVIRQIPSEDLMVLRKKMDDVAGILFDTKV